MRGILCIWKEKLLVIKKKENTVCFEPKGVGGILGERTFCAFAKKKRVFLKKESIVCFAPKSAVLVFLERKIACALEEVALSVLNQTVWEAF